MNWLNKVVDEATAKHPEGEILVSSGGSPSGTYHLGHMRELITCDAIVLELRRRGRQARHYYYVDDLDVFRKVPVNVPAEWDKYLGMPICDVPSPDGAKDKSYADFFLQGLIDSCKALNVEVEFICTHTRYRSGEFVPAIELALEHMPQIRKALETISNRKLDDNWTPVQILENGRLKNRKFLSIDTKAKTVDYEDAQGQKQTARYDKGEVKLDWRIDWPARWWMLKPAVEPFGREHASGGGSYETGVQLMKDVFKSPPPIPVPYGDINMAGDTKKMSASKGTAISAMEAAQIMPAEVIRYFILRSPINTILFFDPVDGLVKLMDEYAELIAKPDRTKVEEQLLSMSTRGGDSKTVSRVPFSHLVASYQSSLKNVNETIEVIKRTEHAKVAEAEAEVIKTELKFIDEWLRLRAPEDVKFELAEKINPADFSAEEKAFLKALGDKVAAAPKDAGGNYFHELVYGLKDQSGLEPKQMFSALYRALIGRPSGPRAGWFLSILPRDWLTERLKTLGNAKHVESESGLSVTGKVQLTDSTSFSVAQVVRDNFPQMAVGYLVAELPAQLNASKDLLQNAVDSLVQSGVSTENLTQQDSIAAWRKAFGTFGVKPSDYLCSAEALAKRALRGGIPRINPLVDAYNAVSIQNLIPMGAIDLDKVHGDIDLRYGKQGEMAQLLGMQSPVEVLPSHVVYADQQQIITWLWNHRDAAATAVTENTRHVVFFADSLTGREPAEQAIEQLTEILRNEGALLSTVGVL